MFDFNKVIGLFAGILQELKGINMKLGDLVDHLKNKGHT